MGGTMFLASGKDGGIFENPEENGSLFNGNMFQIWGIFQPHMNCEENTRKHLDEL
jgi:hypothetical protein